MTFRRWSVVATLPLLLVARTSPAHAQDVLVFECSATFNLAAGTGTSTCNGSVLAGTVAAGTSISTTDDYNATACPLLGTGTGTVSIGGAYYADFASMVVGVAVVAVLSGGHTGASVGFITVAADDANLDVCSNTSVEVTHTGTIVAV